MPLAKASDAELWCFLWSAPGQPVEKIIETLVIWDAIALAMTSLLYCIQHKMEQNQSVVYTFESQKTSLRGVLGVFVDEMTATFQEFHPSISILDQGAVRVPIYGVGSTRLYRTPILHAMISWYSGAWSFFLYPTPYTCHYNDIYAWWRHQMETFSALLAICAGNSPVTGEFPAKWPVTRSFDVFFNLLLNKRLSKQWWCWWFETPSRPLWRHCNGNIALYIVTGADRGLNYRVKYISKYIFVNKDYLTWLLIGWCLWCQRIKCQVWIFLPTKWI